MGEVARGRSTPVSAPEGGADIESRAIASLRELISKTSAKYPIRAVPAIDSSEAAEVRAFARRSQPVLLRGIARDWPLSRLSFEEACHVLRDEVMTVRRGYSTSPFPPHDEVQVTVADYLRAVDSDASEPPYAAQNPVPDCLDELFALPEVFDPSVYGHPLLWLGPAGTRSRLHADAFDNFLIQAHGAKRVILFAPHYADCLYERRPFPRAMISEVDPEDPDLERYPRFANAVRLEVVVDEGDGVFIPCGWFHHVVAESRSMTISVFLKGPPEAALTGLRLRAAVT